MKQFPSNSFGFKRSQVRNLEKGKNKHMHDEYC